MLSYTYRKTDSRRQQQPSSCACAPQQPFSAWAGNGAGNGAWIFSRKLWLGLAWLGLCHVRHTHHHRAVLSVCDSLHCQLLLPMSKVCCAQDKTSTFIWLYMVHILSNSRLKDRKYKKQPIDHQGCRAQDEKEDCRTFCTCLPDCLPDCLCLCLSTKNQLNWPEECKSWLLFISWNSKLLRLQIKSM